jgi:hypothetical protein
VRRRHDASAGLGAEALVAGIGEDLDRWTIGQDPDQA